MNFAEAQDTSFDDSWGCWQPRKEKDCRWKRKYRTGRNDKSGPEADHTSGKGKYTVRY